MTVRVFVSLFDFTQVIFLSGKMDTHVHTHTNNVVASAASISTGLPGQNELLQLVKTETVGRAPDFCRTHFVQFSTAPPVSRVTHAWCLSRFLRNVSLSIDPCPSFCCLSPCLDERSES